MGQFDYFGVSSRIRDNINESGKATPSILLFLLLLGITLIIMSFLENAGGHIVGGLVGGIVVLFASSLWYKYRTFRIRFLNPKEPIKAENMRQYTAIRTDVGSCNFLVKMTPRIGIDLIEHNFAFFDKGKLPWLIGKRRKTDDIEVIRMRYGKNRQDFAEANLINYDKEGITTKQASFSLPSGVCVYYELYVRISNNLKDWEGILSFKILYQRNGNPESKNVRTKFFVRTSNQRRPIRSIGKSVFTALPIESELNN